MPATSLRRRRHLRNEDNHDGDDDIDMAIFAHQYEKATQNPSILLFLAIIIIATVSLT